MDKMTDGEYYNKVVDILKANGFDNSVDFGTVIDDKYNDKTPEESAKEFIDDWS